MSAENFALSVLIVLAALSVPALICAKRYGVLSFAEVALLAAPPFLLYVAMATFNQPAQVGFALFMYPFLTIILCVILLYVRVFLLRKTAWSAFRVSFSVLAVSCVAAFIFGIVAPPWYE